MKYINLSCYCMSLLYFRFVIVLVVLFTCINTNAEVVGNENVSINMGLSNDLHLRLSADLIYPPSGASSQSFSLHQGQTNDISLVQFPVDEGADFIIGGTFSLFDSSENGKLDQSITFPPLTLNETLTGDYRRLGVRISSTARHIL
ncbi:hypothetical protein [Candidatus Colwellia aromaticivorans]|uniref:hypothetical protein n=1 Tax=Candidatus Colwellia aromaticivorans TaxID=2267621 RepID=UPI000DF13FBB|nr:hypothetical protein [Candidatus Colwellia aromaticivorans]